MAREAEDDLNEERRRAIFLALVEAQDLHEFSVPQSRQLIAERFKITEDRVRQIEREGLDEMWPPL